MSNETVNNTAEVEPKVHYLKTWKKYFGAISARIKRFEIRKDDRGILPGDYIMLQEYDEKEKQYTGRQLLVYVKSKMVAEPKFGLKDGFAIFDIQFSEEIPEKQEQLNLILNKML